MKLKDVRDRALLAATFWKKDIERMGVRLSLRQLSPRERYALFNGYEAEDARLCRALLSPGDRVLELGSATGFLALYCIARLGVADYAMVEANPRMIEIIRENFALNGMPLPCLSHCAAGAQDGEKQFHVGREFYSSSLIADARHRATITVPVKSIPSLIREIPFTPNALIMDIEGGEIDIPAEHWGLFDKIVVEFHERYVGRAAIDRIASDLEVHGLRKVASDGFSCAFMRSPEVAIRSVMEDA